MPFSFPSSPAVGATSTQNGREYRYAGNNTWELVAASGGGGSGSIVTAASVSAFPASGSASNLYITSEDQRIWRWDATASIYVESGPIGGGTALTAATANELGGIKVGSGLAITDGVLSATGDTTLRSFFVPGAPTSVIASSASAQQATVSWAAPTVSSQTPITDYAVQFSTNGGTTWTTFVDAVSTATTATVTGLTNGSSYVFRVAAINGLGTGAYSTQSAAVTPGADPLFSSVSLLLHMNGSGDAFVDSSGTPKTITVNGTPTQSATQSKFGEKSMFLNGVSALRIASNSAFGFTTGDFTVEFFLYYTGGTGYVFFYSMSNGYDQYASYGLRSGTKRPWVWNEGDVLQGSTDVTNDVWQHHAVVRSGGVLTLYLDGVAIGSTSFGNNLGSSTVMNIGDNGAGAQRTNGYIDEFRVTKGAARYLANFTPPSMQFLDS